MTRVSIWSEASDVETLGRAERSEVSRKVMMVRQEKF